MCAFIAESQCFVQLDLANDVGSNHRNLKELPKVAGQILRVDPINHATCQIADL